MERICVESTNYVRLKGNYMFTMTVEKLKYFLTILLVSGYAGLPRQERYWERPEDCHNLVASVIITKSKFLECQRCLHLAVITVSIVHINLQKCDHYLMLLTNNSFCM